MAEQKNPFHEGYLAFEAGLDDKENPYNYGTSYYWRWDDGWRAAEDDELMENYGEIDHDFWP